VAERWSEGERHRDAQVFEDERGRLTLVPFGVIPFAPTRAYVLSHLPPGGHRAGHACRSQQRFLTGISGVARVTLEDGTGARTVDLREGDTVHVPPMTWLGLEATGDHVAVLVFADGEYDPTDYISDRSELRHAATSASATSAA
jgi:oxalate decarboxylase/phosphoglucose isomerase-like protein (cupin superfamily)